MASIISVISIFVLLLATYSYSLPVNSATDGSTPAIEVTTGKTMGDHDNSGHFHLATEEELNKMPNIHPPRASAERDSGEAATTDQPATTNQDTSSPMTSTLKTPSTEKTNGKRAYFYTYPSMVRLYDGTLATGSVLTDGTILTHGPIYTDNSLVSYVTSYRRGLDVPPTSETPSKEGEPSTDKPKDKRDYKIERTLLTPMIDHFGQVYEMETPISEHLVFTARALKEDTPSKEGEPSTDKPKDKRDYIVDRSLVSIMHNGFGQLYEVESPLSRHLVVTARALKDDIRPTSEIPSKEGEPSTDKPKDKRALYYEDSSLVRLADGTIGRGSILSHGSVLSNGVMLTHGPIYDNRNMLIRDPMYIDGVARTFVSVDTRGIKDQTKDKDVSKEENSSMTGDHLATTMETSTDFEPRAIKPMDGQSGEETSTFRTNVRPQDGEKQQHSGEMMPKIPDNSKEQKADVIVPGSKQPINKA